MIARFAAQATDSCVPLTPRLLHAAEVLLFHGEHVDVIVWEGEHQEAAWLKGAGQMQVRVSRWYSAHNGRSVPMEQVRLPGETAARLEAIARETHHP